MPIAADLLQILVCPETKQPLQLADETLLEKLNQKVSQGQLRNREGKEVKEELTAGLVRQDKKYFYIIRHDIPIMLIEEAIPLTALE